MVKRTAGWWLAIIGEATLAVAMLLYLGMHSLNFFQWTFKGDQEIFSYLGLFTTSIGVLIWLAILKWKANDPFEKVVALIMLLVALIGEFLVAGFDMYLNISDASGAVAFTADEVRTMAYVIAGLALLNGLALVATYSFDVVIEMFASSFGSASGSESAAKPSAPVAPRAAPFPVPSARKDEPVNFQNEKEG